MKVELITDKQLYALIHNPYVKSALHAELYAEYVRREFSAARIDELNTTYEALLPPNITLSTTGKLLTVLTAFAFPINAGVLIYHSKGSQAMQKQFWKWMVAGYALWLVIIILLFYYLGR